MPSQDGTPKSSAASTQLQTILPPLKLGEAILAPRWIRKPKVRTADLRQRTGGPGEWRPLLRPTDDVLELKSTCFAPANTPAQSARATPSTSPSI